MQALLKASDDIARAKRMKEMIDDAHHQARLNELEREIAGLQQEIAECEAEAVGFFIVPEERRRWWSR